jgi:hypothetical protein
MNVAQSNDEHARREHLADLITNHSAEIEQRWLHRIKAALGDLYVCLKFSFCTGRV